MEFQKEQRLSINVPTSMDILADLPVARFGDLLFPRNCQNADYYSCWTPKFNDRTLIFVTACYESSVLFAAREGWVNSVSPMCTSPKCQGKVRSSYCAKRSDKKG